MTHKPNHARKTIFLRTPALACFGLLLTGCTHHQHAPKVPDWSGDIGRGSVGSAPVQNQTTYSAPASGYWTTQPGVASTGSATFTQGCAGNYVVRDTRTNRDLASGRAFNTGRGLMALDAGNRQVRPVTSVGDQSVIFLPDCNCRRDGAGRSSAIESPQQSASVGARAPTCQAG
jgi:hypothetical protein